MLPNAKSMEPTTCESKTISKALCLFWDLAGSNPDLTNNSVDNAGIILSIKNHLEMI